MICIECGGRAFNNTELCENCMESNRSGTMSLDMTRQCDMSMSCAACCRMVTADSRQCSSCRKNYHLSCDSSDATALDGFVCIQCRRRNNTLLTEDVMLSASAAPRGNNAPLSPFSDPTVPQLALQMPSGPMTSSYPSNADFGVDVYAQMAAGSSVGLQQTIQSQLIDEISDGGATNDSDRNSSPFYQETSDYDEDFVPVSTRGRGRGASKKKPGRGQSSGVRRQTNPPPSGFFSATQLQAAMNSMPPQPTTSTRGKRGKRGNTTPRPSGKGPGRGRGRGRGSAAQAAAVLQQVQYATSASPLAAMFPPLAGSSGSPCVSLPPTPMMDSGVVPNFQQNSQVVSIREVDESMMEEETSRQSGGSRSDEPEYIRTAVVCRANDEFLQKACMCLVCGSVGRGAEGSMVSCSNCAQTYHTYCVNLHDKLNSAVLTRGWRCLDCTVCEGCGTGGDEAKLLLCDECDVSYHIYHMKPPLERIPQGPWRCQWCSRCRRCNHKAASGSDLTPQGLCHPCASLRKCPRCEKGYQLADKIIRCSQCSKWQHGHCEGLYSDEQLEQAATNRMRCSTCRPNRTQSTGFFDADTVVVCDNVALNKNSDEILKSKYTPAALKHHMLETYGYRDSFDHYDDEYTGADDSAEQIAPPAPTGQRGRGRGNPGGRRGTNRIGVGGFFAKLPRHRVLALAEEAAAMAADDDDTKKMKRPRKPRRSQLEDAYPAAIQEAFFGIKAVEGKSLVDISVEEPLLAEYNGQMKREAGLGRAHELSMNAAEMLRNDINENEFLENLDLGNIDTDIDIDNIDFSLLIDDYDDDLEDSLQGEMDVKEEPNEAGGENKFGPTTFNLDQQPSTSTATSAIGGPQNHPEGFQPGMTPANFAQQAPGVRAATTLSRSGSQSTDAPERYQFAERWEEDEPLGLQATTAAVLYANEKHGYLKEQFPEWSDRVKQIQKLWRNLSSEERQDYVNRARENRTNRGKMPRQRRNNVHSTNSVDSPTVQSPAPHQMGFKVPANPAEGMMAGGGIAEESNLPKQVRITCHLPPEIHQQYQDMKRIKADRETLTGSFEIELNKCRKQKKNLAAKKRQMIKTAQTAPDYDGRAVDLNENDRHLLVQLTERIKSMQADVENSKRDLKTHESQLHEFEMRNMILRNEADVTPQMIEQTAIRNQQFAQAEQARVQQAQAQGLAIAGAPPGAQLTIQQQQRMMQFQMMRAAGAPPGAPQQFMMVRPPGAPPLTPQQQQEMHRRMLLQMHQRRVNRWPVMGGMRYDQITDPVMKDVYEFLDEVLHDISVHIDHPRELAAQQQHQQQQQQQQLVGGPPPPHMLKRVLHHPGAPGPPGAPPLHLVMPIQQMPPGAAPPPQQQAPPMPMAPPPPGSQPQPVPPQMLAQPMPIQQMADEGPKPKKKRAIQKKTTSSYPAGGEYDAWIEKMRTRFRLCPEIPKKQREPSLNRIGGEFVKHGMSDMNVCLGRTPLIGDHFGAMRVKRGTALFGNEERRSKVLSFNEVNLYQVDPHIRLVALYNNPMAKSGDEKAKADEEEEVFQDEMDVRDELLNPNAVIQHLLERKRPRMGHIRARARYLDDGKAPLEPEIDVFYEEAVKEEDVTVELVFNAEDVNPESSVDEKKDSVSKFNEQIKDILGIKQEVKWNIEDTPPDSPAPSSPEPTTEFSRAPTVEKEIKKEVEEENSTPVFPREIKKEMQAVECKQCSKSVETAAVRLKMDKLGILPTEATAEEREETVSFCTRKCYYELMATSRVALSHEELAVAEQHVDEETVNRLKQIHSDNIVKAVNQGKSKLPCAPSLMSASATAAATEGLISPRDTRFMMDEGKKEHVATVPVASLIGAVEVPKEVPTQRQTAEDWKAYSQTIFDSFINIHHQHQQYVLSPKIGVPHPPYELDRRLCVFCGGVGDGETAKCGRLISLTEYYWVHVNCALWSAEVYETQTGGLVYVDRAVLRAAQTACNHCKRPGASVKCHKMNCGTNYHVLCAMQNNGHFVKDRTFICKQHERVAQEVCVSRLDALRRIYVKRDENQMLMRLFDLSDGDRLCLRLGAFTFYKLGSIVPKQLKRFHNKDYIFPNQYRITRLFWSPKNHRERMLFECSIEDHKNQPVFVVKSVDDSSIFSRAASATKAWMPIYEKVHQLREQQQGESLKFFGAQISGETLFGLNENAITKITESLPGFDTIFTYQHRHQNSPVLELPLAENPMGCARAEPRNRTIGQHFRTRPQPMGGTSQSTGGQPTHPSITASSSASSLQLETRQAATALTSANSGRTRGVRSYYTEEAAARARAYGISPDLASLTLRMEPMQSTQSTFSAYQKMRREWKDRVFLARSRIAGLGLYAKHDISMGDFIIEYKGEIIRSELCEVREVRYNSQNRGVYMFRIDEEWVIDATMAGGPARYINHSCDPNCSTQILDAGSGAREKKIIITANRPITGGEELTYDYQFELEDSTDKIPCLCGAPNCVKWMN